MSFLRIHPHHLLLKRPASVFCRGKIPSSSSISPWSTSLVRASVSSSEAFIAMRKPAVLQLAPSVPSLRKALETRFEYYSLWEQGDAETFLAEKGHWIHGVVTSPDSPTVVDKALVSKLPNLEIVSSFSEIERDDKIDVPLCKKLGVHVTSTRNALADHAASAAEMLLLSITHEIVLASGMVRRHCRWPSKGEYPQTFKLSNKHVGIVGLGRIGVAIARRLEGFGGTIAYWSRSPKPEFPNYTFYGSVVELAKHSDVLIAACALTKETTKLINREVLEALGPQGYVVNIARGLVIDEKELVKALTDGRIAGAGLDVFENEPHVPKELLGMDNVVLQPHVGSGTIETNQAMADLVAANLEAHFAGKQLLTPV